MKIGVDTSHRERQAEPTRKPMGAAVLQSERMRIILEIDRRQADRIPSPVRAPRGRVSLF
jgi:hypothetical protein